MGSASGAESWEMLLGSVVGITLAVAGLRKSVAGRASFRRSVQAFGIVPTRISGIASPVIPPVEIAAGILLGLGIFPGLSSAVAGLLLTAFAAALAINLSRGRTDIECGCFGAARHAISPSSLARTLVLCVAAWIVARSSDLSSLTDGRWDRPLEGLTVTLAASAVAIVLLGLPSLRDGLVKPEAVRREGAPRREVTR